MRRTAIAALLFLLAGLSVADDAAVKGSASSGLRRLKKSSTGSKTKSEKSPKSTKTPKSDKSPKSPKTPKSAKSPKTPKSPKSAKTKGGAKSPKKAKSPKSDKSPKPPKTPKSEKIAKSPKTPKIPKSGTPKSKKAKGGTPSVPPPTPVVPPPTPSVPPPTPAVPPPTPSVPPPTSPPIAPPTPSVPAGTLIYRINTGSFEFDDPANNTWITNAFDHPTGYNYTDNTTTPIEGTSNPELYRTSRYGMSFVYQIPVPESQNYRVFLHMAEVFHSSEGQRVFNVEIEEVVRLLNYDIIQSTGGPFRAEVLDYTVFVSDGTLSIGFFGVTDNAQISGIEVFAA